MSVPRVIYASGVAVAEAAIARRAASAERKQAWSIDAGRASFQDRDNFVTNRVTLADYQDSAAGTERGALGLSATWACVNLLAGTIASLPLLVYRTGSDGQRAVARDHPLYYRLHDSPNADQTALDFWEFVQACIELKGNAFSEILRGNDGRVIALAPPFAPDGVQVKRGTTGAIEYLVRFEGAQRVLRQEQMLHVRGFGGSPLGGLSTLSYGRRTFGTALAIEASAASTFRNGVRPSGILTKDGAPLTKDQRAEAETLLVEKYQGALNAGVPMLLDGGVTFHPITINPDDAQMLESRAFSVEEICRFFGVPPFMVGHSEKSTSWGTGIEQQMIGFVQFTLRRRLKRIEQALEKQLLTAADRAQGVRIEFSVEGLLRGDSKSRAEFYASGLQNGWRTINEVRALENLPPVEGGDVSRMQSQNVPITDVPVAGDPGVTLP
jgi:HK97 family phage portal protein